MKQFFTQKNSITILFSLYVTFIEFVLPQSVKLFLNYFLNTLLHRGKAISNWKYGTKTTLIKGFTFTFMLRNSRMTI